jgi:hypothetical protein
MDFEDIMGDGGNAEFGEGNEGSGMFNLLGMNQEEQEEYRDQKDSVIFLIDCHSTMFADN